jgi:hypothetical protein
VKTSALVKWQEKIFGISRYEKLNGHTSRVVAIRRVFVGQYVDFEPSDCIGGTRRHALFDHNAWVMLYYKSQV